MVLHKTTDRGDRGVLTSGGILKYSHSSFFGKKGAAWGDSDILFRCFLCSSLWSLSGQHQRGGDPKAHPKPSGEILYFVWPVNASRFPRRNWKVCPGSSVTPKGFKGTRCLKIMSRKYLFLNLGSKKKIWKINSQVKYRWLKIRLSIVTKYLHFVISHLWECYRARWGCKDRRDDCLLNMFTLSAASKKQQQRLTLDFTDPWGVLSLV